MVAQILHLYETEIFIFTESILRGNIVNFPSG